MCKKGMAAALVLVLGTVDGAGAQSLGLDEAVRAAQTSGADQAVMAANLRAVQGTYELAKAKAGLTLSGAGAYSGSQTVNSPESTAAQLAAQAAVATVGAVTVDKAVPQAGSVSLTLANPVTSLTFKGTENFEFNSAGTLNHVSQDSLVVSQTLWNGYWGGPLEAAAEKAALTYQIAQLNYRANANKLVLTVKQAFFSLLSAQEAMNQLDQTRNQRADTVRFTQAKLSVGQATDLDLKSSRINFLSADLDWQAGRSALTIARKRLLNLMGSGDRADLKAAVEPDPAIPAETLEEAVALALKNRVEPRIAQANAQAAAIDQWSAVGAATPSVSLSGGVVYNKDWQTDKTSVVGSFGVNLGLPLWDGGASQAQGTSADANRLAAETQYRQLLASVPVDVTEAWNAWKVNQQRFEVAGASVEVAQGLNQVAQTQYDAGLKTLTDLQTAQINVTTAQFTLIKAKITYQLSALTLLSLLGL